MARPIKEGMDYFPHDTDATNDEKIEALNSGVLSLVSFMVLINHFHILPASSERVDGVIPAAYLGAL